MKETLKKMRARHEKEIAELQENCKHKKISEWMPFAWAVGHFSGAVKVCEACDKIVERLPIDTANTATYATYTTSG